MMVEKPVHHFISERLDFLHSGYLLAANLISYLVDQPSGMVLDIFPLSIEVANVTPRYFSF